MPDVQRHASPPSASSRWATRRPQFIDQLSSADYPRVAELIKAAGVTAE